MLPRLRSEQYGSQQSWVPLDTNGLETKPQQDSYFLLLLSSYWSSHYCIIAVYLHIIRLLLLLLVGISVKSK